MRSWMKYSMYIISLVLVALILLPSFAVGKPPEDKGKDKDNGKPPKTKDEDKDNGKPPKTEDEDKNNGKPPKTKDKVEFVTITSSSGSHGNVSPSGAVKVKVGDDRRFKIRANGGYSIEKVEVDGKLDPEFEDEKGENKHIREWEHLFENVQESHSIYATFERDVFTIKALARGPGRISPSGAVKVSYGDSQDFAIRATRGFCIDNVQISPSDDKNTLDMDAAKGASTYTFSFNDVTLDYTIIVTFARLKEPEPDPETDLEPLTIESKVEDGGGSIDPLGEVEVEYGSDQTFTMTPEPCHRISAVLVDEELVVEGLYIDEETGVGTYTFSDVEEDHTINIIFEEITYTIVVSADDGGSIDPPVEVEVVCGSDQTFTITPGPCYSIAEVSVGDPPVAVAVDIDEETGIGTYTFEDVSSDDNIHATFEEITYTITASAGDGGSIDPSGGVEVVCGSDQAFTITPDLCYSIAEVSVGDPPVAVAVDIDEETGIGTYTFTNVSSDDAIYATFEQVTEPYTIIATSDEFGSIDPSGGVEVACGSDQTFTITPGESCYSIAEVLVGDPPVAVAVDIDEETGVGTYTFEDVSSDDTIHATFEKTTYTITASADDGSSIDPSGEVEVVCGSDQTFTITPGPCYSIAEVLVGDPPVAVAVDIDEETGIGTYTFEDVSSDDTIHATFEKITYTIAASAGDVGSIDPSGEVEVACGSDQTFTITPGPCYSIAEVSVGDPPVAVAVDIDEETGIGTYTFEDVSSDDTIYATFEEVTEPYTIIATSDEFGSIDPSGEVEVVCGSDQTFTITPGEPCYSIAEVLVGDPPVAVAVDAVDIDEETGIGTYTFTNVASDDIIHATFKKTTYTIETIAIGNGRIDPSGKVQVECGGSQLFRIRPEEGYTRGSVLIDGDAVKTKGNKYEFTDVDSDHIIQVTFVEDLDEDDPKGDVNNDGKVSSGDAIFILLIITGQIEPTEQQKLAADVNGDGVIDIDDALYVLNIVTGLAAPDANVDDALLQNFPNPFNPETWIPFTLSEGSEVTIEIYDAMGHLVRRLPLGHKSAGFYTSQERAAYWDGCNEHGERVASGVYFYAIRAADFADMKKMIIAQ